MQAPALPARSAHLDAIYVVICHYYVVQDRVTLGKMQNPVRGFLHGSAAVVAAVGAGILIARASSGQRRIALAVYGLGLVALYTTSSLYHSVPWREEWKKRMQRLDHAMIFVLIASTITPIGVIVLDGWMRIVTVSVAWSIAAFGVGHLVLVRRQRFDFSIGLMVTMGWLSLALMVPLARRVGAALVILIAVGGLVYTVGMVIVVTQRPRLWPRVFSSHELFHVLVVTASVLHFVAIYRYVVPFMSGPPGKF
jgi:hemolysin III